MTTMYQSSLLFKSLSAEIMLKTNSNIEQALFCAEQAFSTALKYKLNIYLPQIADMLLLFIILFMSGQQSQEVVQSLNQKIEYVKTQWLNLYSQNKKKLRRLDEKAGICTFVVLMLFYNAFIPALCKTKSEQNDYIKIEQTTRHLHSLDFLKNTQVMTTP